MSNKKRKSFGSGIDAIFGAATADPEEKIVEEPVEKKTPEKVTKKASSLETRTTLRLEVDVLEKMRAVAYWERKPMKKVLSEALEAYFVGKGDPYMKAAMDSFIENN